MGTREVAARGGDGTNAPVFGKPGVGWGIISELFQSCRLRLDAPAGTQECPLLATDVISDGTGDFFSAFLSTPFSLSVTTFITGLIQEASHGLHPSLYAQCCQIHEHQTSKLKRSLGKANNKTNGCLEH